VTYWTLPSVRISSCLMSGAVILSTKMAVPTLMHWEFPIGIPGF